MSDDPTTATALRDALVALGLGIAAIGGWLWRYARPGLNLKTPVVTPADVRARVDELMAELRKLQYDVELFIQEERQVHPQIINLLQEAIREVRDASRIAEAGRGRR